MGIGNSEPTRHGLGTSPSGKTLTAANVYLQVHSSRHADKDGSIMKYCQGTAPRRIHVNRNCSDSDSA